MRATIKMKLGVTFATLILLLAVVVGVGITKMSVLNTAITNVINDPAKSCRSNSRSIRNRVRRLPISNR